MTTADVLALVKAGYTARQIADMQDAPEAASTVAAPPVVSVAPDWLIARGARKADRRALAATMRAAGQDPSDAAAWKAAKKAAGITAAEIKAHKAFLAKA